MKKSNNTPCVGEGKLYSTESIYEKEILNNNDSVIAHSNFVILDVVLFEDIFFWIERFYKEHTLVLGGT